MTQTTTQQYEQRAKRLQDVIDGYEVYEDGMPDSTVPHAARVVRDDNSEEILSHPRYVLVEQRGDKGNYYVNLAEDLVDLERLAAHGVQEGSMPVCYYDLDQLAGEEQLPTEVEVAGVEWMVHGEEWIAGERTGAWVLKKQPDDKRRRTYDWSAVDPSECDVMGWEDERMPVRYLLAKVTTVVAFNSTPEQP